MKDEDIQNLLGGFATDTLTDRERELLFTAALQNQELFDALANDQALRDLLSDPASRRQLLQALEPRTLAKLLQVAEIAPDAPLPGNAPLSQLLAQVDRSGVEKLDVA